eukprot:1460197-Pyramimonas_sp.AAC.1
MWDDVATLVRARMNRRVEDYEAAGTFPRIMVLDCACFYRKLQRPSSDVYHFLSEHSGSKIDKDGQMVRGKAAEMFGEHIFKAAKLAALLFCQPSGGPAVQGGSPSAKKRADGHTAEEATFKER